MIRSVALRISVAVTGDSDVNILNLDVGPDLFVGDLKALIQSETSVSTAVQVLHFNGKLLANDHNTLGAEELKDGDIISMFAQVAQAAPRGSGRAGPSQSGQRQGATQAGPSSRMMGDAAEDLRQRALANASIMSQIRNTRASLADTANDPRRWREEYSLLIAQQMEERRKAELEQAEAYRRLEEDPFDVEAQIKIEKIIQQENIDANYNLAYEENPEVFGQVHMLYIPVEVNNVKIKAFVDSGAQATVMSPDCAEACGIMRLVDTRYSGMARGVGTAKIVGRVHAAQLKIGGAYFLSSFTVMEGKDVDLLLGLDMLKRFQATIDLKGNRLSVAGQEIPFLSESEIPKKDFVADEPLLDGPDGTKIGGISGSVLPPPGPPAPESTGAASKSAVTSPSPAASSSLPPQLRAGPPPQPPRPQQPPQSRFPAADIEQLTNLGFAREEAIHALEIAEGDVERAAGFLYG
ncbi:DNA damage-inducible protein 1 [Agyrium rufum]|nr:DNA damage-inducible protein 1 [Agyrium rufum]